MSKLIEVNHVSLAGEVGTNDWALPFLDEDHERYATSTLNGADALLLGRRTYEGLSAAYVAMPSNPFVDRMNAIPKYVATRTLHQLRWNATPIDGDVGRFVSELKERSTSDILRYGHGQLDVPLMEQGLIDEFHVLLTPVAVDRGQHLFEKVTGEPRLHLVRLEQFRSGVVLLVYSPHLPADAPGNPEDE